MRDVNLSASERDSATKTHFSGAQYLGRESWSNFLKSTCIAEIFDRSNCSTTRQGILIRVPLCSINPLLCFLDSKEFTESAPIGDESWQNFDYIEQVNAGSVFCVSLTCMLHTHALEMSKRTHWCCGYWNVKANALVCGFISKPRTLLSCIQNTRTHWCCAFI